MSDITTKILLESELKELAPDFHFLENTSPFESAFKNWYYKYDHALGYKNSKKLNVIFIGQTGYGKSSLINKLIDKDVFETSDYQSCTKTLQSANFFLNHSKKNEYISYVLSFVDLPGIGENDKEDEKYLQWYKDYINEASVIVYLFRADKRDHTQDEFFFRNIFDDHLKNNLVCVISQADKIEPINRSYDLSDAQKQNLCLKENEIKNKPFLCFDSLPVVHVSSHLNINIDKLRGAIVGVLNTLKSG
ncbi:GTPase family protein [Photobacterium damselae]|uniref:GTPase family protein n=1 Tax=Photobacterium damselae TaxID=38293 RepID=UPI0025433EC7